MKNLSVIILITLTGSFSAQSVGIGTFTPTHTLHVIVDPANPVKDPLKIEGIKASLVNDTMVLVTDTATGIIRSLNINSLSSGNDTDIDSIKFINDTLYIYEDDKIRKTYIASSGGVDNDWDINANGTGLEAAPAGNNIASGLHAMAGGFLNTSSAVYTTISGGVDNEATAAMAVVSGGQINRAYGANSSIGGGASNTASGAQSTIGGGEINRATFTQATVSGGGSNIASGYASTVSGGRNNEAYSYGEWVGGFYNRPYTPSSTTNWIASDRLFTVGNGQSAATRSNGMVLYKDGRLELNEAYTLPNTDGTSNQVLTTNGSGVVNWTTPSGGSSGWLLTGNAGTTPGTNFLGTTDNQDMIFKRNNSNAGRIGTTVTSFGALALNSNTGNSNTAFGVQAMFVNTTGTLNTAVGHVALSSNTTGGNNAALGHQALRNNTTGSRNTGIGQSALDANTIGNDNTSLGNSALFGNTTGNQNTSVGQNASFTSTAANATTAVGQGALFYNTGNNNTAVGRGAILNNQTGINNTAIGYQAYLGSFGTSYSNSTALGANSVINANNKIRVGDATVTTIEGQVAYSFPSDGRFKINVTEDVKGLDFILNLRPVIYNFDTKKFDEFLLQEVDDSTKNEIIGGKDYTESTAIRQTGFIAQEVEEAANKAGYDFNGVHKPTSEKDHYSVAYSQFVMPLVQATKEQQVIIETLKEENVQMKKELAEIKALLLKQSNK